MASDPMSDLEQLISNAMGSAFEGARKALADDIRRRHDADKSEAREGAFRALREANTRLDAARTQSELLSALLEEAGRFAARAALLLTFPDAAHGWAAFGFDGTIDHLRLGYDEPGLRELAGGRGAVSLGADDGAALARHLGGGAPLEAVLVPLVLRDRVAAALYADHLRADDGFAPAALQLLTYAAAQALELQVVRQREATPTLYGAGTDMAPAALPLWDPAAAAAATPATAAPAAPTDEPLAGEAAAGEQPAPEAGEASIWRGAAPAEPTGLDSVDAAEEPGSEPAWADESDATDETDEAPTAPGAEPWPVEAAPAPWETEPEPPAEAQAWAAQEEQVAADDELADEHPPATAEETAGETVPEVAAQPWQYGEALEEVPAAVEPEEAGELSYEATPLEETGDGVEELGAAAVEEIPTAEAEPEAQPGWQEPAAESATSELYPADPSGATVRISRDLLTAGPLAPPPRPAVAPDFSEDRTVRLQRPEPLPAANSVASPAPSPEGPRTTGPVSLPSSGASTEVQAPPDLEGPGWAFRGAALPAQPNQQRSEESSALHEEARRLARLLVSEIKLYNEEMVEEGRRHRDIYPRLQDDIDRSRQMYEERVDARVRGEVDYFQQEMVNILAGGDAGALGM
jgi:hypothetical protein